jgi:hypothetical protein
MVKMFSARGQPFSYEGYQKSLPEACRKKSAAKPRNQIGQSFVRQILPFAILELLGSVTWSRSLNGVSRCARSL